METYLFTSERLGFRNWKMSDLDYMHSINSDPVVMEYFPSLQSREQTLGFIERMQKMFAERHYCYFALEELASKNFIGFTGMFYQEYPTSFTPCTDIGWRLAKPYWGKGYATEAAKRCIAYALDTLGLDSLKATAPGVNQRSINVMQKAGMSYLLDFLHPRLADHPLLQPCVCYEINREHK